MSYKDQHLYVLLSDDHDPTFGSLDNAHVEDSARVFTGDECLALAEAMLYFEEHGTRKGDAPVQYKDGLGNIVDSRKRISVLNSIGEKLGLT